MTNDDDLRVYGAEGRARTLPLPSAQRSKPRLVHDLDAAVHAAALEILREAHANDGDAPVSQDVYNEAVRQARARLGASGRPHAINDDDPVLAEVRRDFSSNYADDVDRASALVHLKAEVVCAAAGRPIDERSYLAALNAVSDSSGGRSADDELEGHLEAAEAISDLAQARLAERRDFPNASGYEHRYIGEVARIADEFKLDLYKQRS
jgi:hypothetical protein